MLAFLSAVVGAAYCGDMPSGRQVESRHFDFRQVAAAAEAWNVVVIGVGRAPPGMVRRGDPLDLALSQLDLHAADLAPHMPRVDKYRLVSSVALRCGLLVAV